MSIQSIFRDVIRVHLNKLKHTSIELIDEEFLNSILTRNNLGSFKVDRWIFNDYYTIYKGDSSISISSGIDNYIKIDDGKIGLGLMLVDSSCSLQTNRDSLDFSITKSDIDFSTEISLLNFYNESSDLILYSFDVLVRILRFVIKLQSQGFSIFYITLDGKASTDEQHSVLNDFEYIFGL